MKDEGRREFEAVLAIAEDSYGFPVDHWLDEIIAVQKYLFGGQADFDRLIEEVEIGIRKSKDIVSILNHIKKEDRNEKS